MSFTASLEEIISDNESGLLACHPTWVRCRLGDVAQVLNGFPFPSKQFSKTVGVPLLRIRDVTNGSTETKYDGDYDPAYLVRQGDLVVGMDGDFNCALWRGPDAVLNQRVCKITADENFYSKRFLSHALPGYLSAINAATSSVTVKHLSSLTVQDIPLPFPPPSEQRRIVAEIEKQFTRLDAAVAALERTRANLKRYRAAVLRAAVEGRLVSDDVTSPETWTKIRFEEILTFLRNGVSKKPDAEGGLPILRISAVRPGAVDLSDVRFLSGSPETYRDYIIESGDLLFTRYNGNPDFVGVCGVVRNVNRSTIHPDKLIRAKVKPDIASARYLEIALNTGEARQFLARRVRTTAGQSGVSGGDIRQIPLSLPPLKDQERIASEVELRLSAVNSLQASLAARPRAARGHPPGREGALEGKFFLRTPDDEPSPARILGKHRGERRGPSCAAALSAARKRQ